MPTRHWLKSLRLSAVCCGLLLVLALPLLAAEIQLKNGMVLRGTVTPLPELNVGRQKNAPGKDAIQSFPIVMVADELRRCFIAERQIARVDRERDPTMKAQEIFTLNQPHGGSQSINSLGAILEVGKWDDFGRRSIVLRGSPKDITVVQGITQITPEYVKIQATKFQWETALPITSIPPDVLDRILRKKMPEGTDDQHLAIVRFYIQAGFYRQAQQELQSLKYSSKSPDLQQRVEEVSASLAQAQGRQILEELKLRQASGQYRFVYELLLKFPKDKVDGPLLKEIAANLKTYELMRDARELTISRLGELQAQLKSTELEKEVGGYRSEIVEKLDYQNLGKMEAFLRLGGEQSLLPEDRLGLALSGWIVGSAHAENNLPLALRLWQARFVIQQYLRAENPNDQAARLAELEKLDGVTPERVAQILKALPPVVDSQIINAGQATQVQVTPTGQNPDVNYTVLLPPEYHPDHSYPLIVALPDRGASTKQELSFWAGTAEKPGQSQRHGYIVIAPEYMPDNGAYDYSTVRHQIVLESLRDARRRFNVDTDRVYLSGHGRGGDATYDIGLSHPDLFAGIIPISGVCDNGSKESKTRYYWQNAKTLPIYAISGELDRDTFNRSARDLNHMLDKGYDVMLSEYRGYGRDSFYAEIHKLFAWMSLHRRGKIPQDFTNYTMRPDDNRFHWLEMSGIPVLTNRAMKVSGRVPPGSNAIFVTGNVGSVTLWLNPELIKFDQKLEVRLNGQVKWTRPVKADTKAMLEDFRHRADRQNLYWALLAF